MACGVAGSSAELVAARLVQGLGVGIYYPAIRGEESAKPAKADGNAAEAPAQR